MVKSEILPFESDLFNEISALIDRSQAKVLSQVNNELTLLFWKVGTRINEFVLEQSRAKYGQKIVVTLSRQLSWSHFLVLLPLKSDEQRQFYARRTIQEQLGVRGLRKQIAQKTFERTAIANAQLPVVTHPLSGRFKDPYLLDFLNLPADYLEYDLETAILKELEKFILEVGKGFAFVERQKLLKQ